MSETRSVATLRVRHPDDPEATMLINAVDFDPDEHTLVEQPSAEAVAAVHARERQKEVDATRTTREREWKGVAKPTADPTKAPATVRIAHPDVAGAVMVINATEFDASIHELVEEQREVEASATAASGLVVEVVSDTPIEPPATDVDPSALVEQLQANAKAAADAAEAEARQREADAATQAAAEKGPRAKRRAD